MSSPISGTTRPMIYKNGRFFRHDETVVYSRYKFVVVILTPIFSVYTRVWSNSKVRCNRVLVPACLLWLSCGRRLAEAGNVEKHSEDMGQRHTRASLGIGYLDHRYDWLRLVDESHSRASRPIFLSFDPCRYRIRRTAVAGFSPALAFDQSNAIVAAGKPALGTLGGKA